MNEKPILFNTEMVRAILDGRKTQTRRLVVPHYRDGDAGYNVITNAHTGEFCYIEYYDEDERSTERRLNPPYAPGDILWVRETWNYGFADSDYKECAPNDYFFQEETPGKHGKYDPPGLRWWYRADKEDEQAMAQMQGFWKPSIFMPKAASRIFLRVTDVRAKRLRDSFDNIVTSVENYKDEGIDIGETCKNCIEDYGNPTCRADVDEDGMMIGECHQLDQVRSDFSDLWDKTIKPADRSRYGWAANPYVWVIKFEVVKPESIRNATGQDEGCSAYGGLMPAT